MSADEQPPASATGDLSEKDQDNGITNGQLPQVNGLKHHEGERRERKEKEEKDKGNDSKDGEEEKKPPGGFDSTKIPRREPGYTLKITFHRATNLPMADYTSWSSDPYIVAQIYTGLPTRHKEDPPLRLRTRTIRRSTEPEWNCEWIVANIPTTGFRMKARIYDEDPSDHDDRLGNAHITVSSLSESWPGIQNKAYDIKKRSGSKRAYLIRALATCLEKSKHMNGLLYVSIEMLGRTETDNGGRAYTVGPMWYTKHYSPLLGRIAGRKEPEKEEAQAQGLSEKQKVQKYK
jgi:C2 domain